MSEEQKSLIQQAAELSNESFIRFLSIETDLALVPDQGEHFGICTSSKPVEPLSIESLIEINEALKQRGCPHVEFISIQRYMPAEQGERYICAQCFKKMIVVPKTLPTAQLASNPWRSLYGIWIYGADKDE